MEIIYSNCSKTITSIYIDSHIICCILYHFPFCSSRSSGSANQTDGLQRQTNGTSLYWDLPICW